MSAHRIKFSMDLSINEILRGNSLSFNSKNGRKTDERNARCNLDESLFSLDVKKLQCYRSLSSNILYGDFFFGV